MTSLSLSSLSLCMAIASYIYGSVRAIPTYIESTDSMIN